MGYELHIVRRGDYEDVEETSSISLEEWLKYVKSDQQLELTNGYQLNVPGFSSSFQNVPGFCIWHGHSQNQGDTQPWLDYGHGMISTKNPDEETIRKMIKIAAALNARVMGDDGEMYTALDYPDPNEKPWWKFW